MQKPLPATKRCFCAAALCVITATGIAAAADWPMWRYDAGRSACSPEQLPGNLNLLWSRKLPAPSPAWPPSQFKLQFDVCYQPVAADGRVFVPSNTTDSVTAYDADTGRELWKFYAEAPVRFAPAVYRDTVLFASDDGYLYCVAASTGKLKWKYMAAPAERRGVGNNRLTSSWPARGGPVIHEGKVYVSASIWPFMGIFYHCLDADTGTVYWTNSGEGARWTVHPHGAPSFASVAPHGYLAMSDGQLVVPGGRSTPGVFDAATGTYRFFKYDKKGGGGPVFAGNGHFFNSGSAYVLTTGDKVHKVKSPVLCENEILTLDGSSLKSYRWDTTEKRLPLLERRGLKTKGKFFQDNWSGSAGGISRLFIRAGNRVYGASGTKVVSVELGAGGKTSSPWSADLSAGPGAMIAADGKLIVAALDGSIHCFGSGRGGSAHDLVRRPLGRASGKWNTVATAMLTASEMQVGFAVVLGVGSGELVNALIASSKLHVIVVEPDAQKADSFRRKLDAAGAYGSRAAVLVGDPNSYPFAPYLATIIASEDSSLVRSPSKKLLSALRPYGGAAWLPCSQSAATTAAQGIEGLTVSAASGMAVITRKGALYGSGPWSHQYGDATNSVTGEDKRVKLPLGLLWFGGPSNDKILPRHGHGPSPQVAGGRLVIEGRHILRSVDVYTGMVIWERELRDIGLFHDNTAHRPGAGEIGGNYVTLPDAVYVAHNRSCLKLDPRTGETAKTFIAPKTSDGQAAHWGYLGVDGDHLVATFTPVAVASKGKSRKPPKSKPMGNSTPVIKQNATWRYLADGKHPRSGWNGVGFDDSSWKTGQAGFGYGDGDDKTVLRNMRGKYTAVYVRSQFEASAADGATKMGLMIDYDDGFVAYLNGKEIARKGVSGSGSSVKRVSSHEAGGHEFFEISNFKNMLRSGTNVLALEGHNAGAGSSDFSLNPYLVIVKTKPAQPPSTRLKKVPGRAAPSKVDPPGDPYAAGSLRLAVLDRNTGEILWTRRATTNFRHNAISLTDGVVYCLDHASDARASGVASRSGGAAGAPTLYALDMKSGRVIWQTSDNIFGTWLGYSREHDILVQGGSKYRDRARDETGKGLVAYRGKTGEVIWDDLELSYAGPPILHRNSIITNGSSGFSLDILTGKRTGWAWKRHYGCNTAIACDTMLTFRSGAAGFCDLDRHSGTGNFGGFKSSCTSNLIPADGVLNAPDYTRTCSCAYQNQSSLAMVYMPEAEVWTFGGTGKPGTLALNFGAPGNRRGPKGALWIDLPSVGGEKAPSGFNITGDYETVRYHASRIGSGELPWVSASGVEGDVEVTAPLASGTYDITLVFAELGGKPAGERRFDVLVGGKPAVRGLDIAREAGGEFKTVVKTLRGVSVSGSLKIATKSSRGKAIVCGLLAEKR